MRRLTGGLTSVVEAFQTIPPVLLVGEVLMAGLMGLALVALTLNGLQGLRHHVLSAADGAGTVLLIAFSAWYLAWSALRLRRTLRRVAVIAAYEQTLKGRPDLDFALAGFGVLRERDRPWQLRWSPVKIHGARVGGFSVHYERLSSGGEVVIESRHAVLGVSTGKSGPATARWTTAVPGAPDARVLHFDAKPEEILVEPRRDQLLPRGAFVYIGLWEAAAGSTVSVFRYTGDGRYAGDTWHRSLDAARAQLVFEYGEAAAEWHEIPAGVRDPVRYALEVASQ